MMYEGVLQLEETEFLVFSEKTCSPEALYRLKINLSMYDI